MPTITIYNKLSSKLGIKGLNSIVLEPSTNFVGFFSNAVIDEAIPELNSFRSAGYISYSIEASTETDYVENTVIEATTAQRIANAGTNTLIYDTDLQRLYVWNPTASEWQVATEAIVNDTTYYVDGDAGDDDNDGLSWATAFKTFSFLWGKNTTSVIPLSREVNADVTVNCRGTILSNNTVTHIQCDYFYGTGSISIVGFETTVISGVTATSYSNTATNVEYHSYISSTGATWVVNAYKGDYLKVTSGTGSSATKLYPILSNTATRIETYHLPNLGATSRCSIVSMPSVKGATVAAPLVLTAYSDSFIKVKNCSIPISMSNLDALTTTAAQYIAISGTSTLVSLTNVSSFPTLYVDSSPYVSVNRCYFMVNNFGYISITGMGCSLSMFGCVMDGDATGYGVFLASNTYCVMIGCRFYNQYLAGTGYIGASLSFISPCLFDTCDTGIDCNSLNVSLSTAAAGPMYFDTCGTCITLGGGRLEVGKSTPFYTNAVTTEIKIDDETNIATFAQLTANKAISNNAGSVNYFDISTYKSFSPAKRIYFDTVVSGTIGSAAPSLSSISGLFGSASSVGAGFGAVINNSVSNCNYIIQSDGTDWWWFPGTRAV